jgi:signal transduction histidine kinase
MEVEKVIVFGVVSGVLFTVGLLFVILGLIFNFRKKKMIQDQEFEVRLKNKELELMSMVVGAQEQERTKIARNLHDEVGSILSMAQRNVGVVLNDSELPNQFHNELQFTMDALEQSINQIRNLSQSMLPHYLIKFGLEKAIKRFIEQTEHIVEGHYVFESKLPENFSLKETDSIQFYSIFLELMNNIIKHGRPHEIQVHIELKNEELILSINHDGVAISQSDYEYLLQNGSGVGLSSIQNRLLIIDGKLHYHKNEHGGNIQLTMPFENKAS